MNRAHSNGRCVRDHEPSWNQHGGCRTCVIENAQKYRERMKAENPQWWTMTNTTYKSRYRQRARDEGRKFT